MMKKVFGLVSFVFSLVILFSCEPGRDENGDLLFGVNEPPNGDNKLLQEMSVTDSTGAVTVFNYKYTKGILQSININDDEDDKDIILTYNNAKKLSKFVITERDSLNIVKTTVNLIYTNDLLTSATGNMESAGFEVNKNLTNFTYLPNGKLQKIVTRLSVIDPANPSGSNELFKYTTDLVFTGDNISNLKLTINKAPQPPIVFPPVIMEAGLSNYDTFKNPLATLPREFNIAAANFLMGTNSVQGLSVNNYKTVTVQSDGKPVVVNYTYIYDDNGYPVSATAPKGTLKFKYITP